MSATIYAVGGTEKTLILATRQSLIRPFTAPNWTDLRLALYLSLVTAGSDSIIPTPTETLNYSTPTDNSWIGFKDNGTDTLPALAGSLFAGIMGNLTTNTLTPAVTDSDLTYFVAEGVVGTSFVGGGGTYLHAKFPGTDATTNYAYPLIVRMTRANSGTATIQTAYQSFDHTSASGTPTIAALRALLRSNTTYASATGNLAMGTVPSAIFIHWPFFNSRLRIHAMVLEKFA